MPKGYDSPCWCVELSKRFPNRAAAAKFIGRQSIVKAVDKPHRFAGGYRWETYDPLKHVEGMLPPPPYVRPPSRNLHRRPSKTGVKGSGIYNRKPVWCVELRKRFVSVSEATRFIGCKTGAILSAIDKPGRTSGGYQWETFDPTRHVEGPPIGERKRKRKPAGHPTPTWCVELARRFDCQNDAARFVHRSNVAVGRAMNRLRFTSAGYHWQTFDPRHHSV